MTNKRPIDKANPFLDSSNVVQSISDIQRLNAKVEFKSENGIIVALPDGNTCLLLNSNSEELSAYESGDPIDIFSDSEGNAYKANEKYELYKICLC